MFGTSIRYGAPARIPLNVREIGCPAALFCGTNRAPVYAAPLNTQRGSATEMPGWVLDGVVVQSGPVGAGSSTGGLGRAWDDPGCAWATVGSPSTSTSRPSRTPSNRFHGVRRINAGTSTLRHDQDWDA